jgi:hypothetical protein
MEEPAAPTAIPLRPHTRNLDDDPFKVGIDAAERLRRALDRHGLVIPSLRGTYPMRETPMVELGNCRAEVAETIADLLDDLLDEREETKP